MKPNRKCRRATSCTTFALAITFLGALLGTAFVSVTTEAQGRSLLTRLPAVPEETSQDLKKKELRREAEKVEKDAEGKGQESDPYAFFVPGVVVFLYLGFGTIYSTECLGLGAVLDLHERHVQNS
ncbi:unnamed protein product [Durusdinium trenchii]|uniref:Transmembrane protein n=1 Tax=Durusdinium trenchii TaxID=1381693 RepID=A0ABP0PWY1_9DINO